MAPLERVPSAMRIDHVGLDVKDYERSKAFYEKTLAPLGMRLMMEPAPEVGGFGGDSPFFWIGSATAAPDGRARGDHRQGPRDGGCLPRRRARAGGTDNGGPGVREIYHPDYYGAFVLDPDGNNIEAVCHKPG